jgi:hypothetical protein
LSSDIPDINVSPGIASVLLDTLDLSSTANPLTITELFITALNTLALESQAQPVAVVPGNVSLSLDTLDLLSAIISLSILQGAGVAGRVSLFDILMSGVDLSDQILHDINLSAEIIQDVAVSDVKIMDDETE